MFTSPEHLHSAFPRDINKVLFKTEFISDSSVRKNKHKELENHEARIQSQLQIYSCSLAFDISEVRRVLQKDEMGDQTNY